jgi:hypothetical protein
MLSNDSGEALNGALTRAWNATARNELHKMMEFLSGLGWACTSNVADDAIKRQRKV